MQQQNYPFSCRQILPFQRTTTNAMAPDASVQFVSESRSTPLSDDSVWSSLFCWWSRRRSETSRNRAHRIRTGAPATAAALRRCPGGYPGFGGALLHRRRRLLGCQTRQVLLPASPFGGEWGLFQRDWCRGSETKNNRNQRDIHELVKQWCSNFLARGPHLSFRNPSRATRINNLNKNSLINSLKW